MRIFIGKLLLVGFAVSLMVLTLSAVPDWRYDFKPGQTESNLLVIPRDTRYDLLILGTSHGKIFSRSGNHDRVEAILEKTVMNLSTGGGRGVYAARLYLDYFFARGNTAEAILYFIDPWVLYSDKWNEQNDLFNEEPIDLRFLMLLLRRGMNIPTVVNYLKSNIAWEWVTQHPKPDTENAGRLAAVDPDAVAKRISSLYPDGLDAERFRTYAGQLADLAATAAAKGIRLIFVIPTALLGDLPGENALQAALGDLEKRFGAAWYDLSNAITDSQFYYDHDHLNTKGIVAFTEKYLRPILR